MEIEERRNGTERDQCIVLRAVPYKEADLILTLFSRQHGRIDARAYGARSLKSTYRAACQPFCAAEFEFYLKNGRRSVRSADIRREFFGLQSDFRKYAAGCVLLELAEKMLEGHSEEDRDQMFLLLLHSLSAMESEKCDPHYIVLFFFLRAAYLLGVFPSLRSCVECGAPAEENVSWSYTGGGVVCAACAAERDVSSIDPAVLSCLRTFGRGRPCDAQDISFDISTVDSALHVMENMLRHQLGLRLRASRMLVH